MTTKKNAKAEQKSGLDRPLYEIGADYRARFEEVMAFAEDHGGEISDELNAWLTDDEANFDEKVERCVQQARIWEHDAEAGKIEGRRIKEFCDYRSRRATRLLEYVRMNMAAVGKLRVERPGMVIKVQGNPPKVEVTDPDAVPDAYVTIACEIPAATFSAILQAAMDAGVEMEPFEIARKVDRNAVLQAWKDCGEQAFVPGTTVTRSNHLRVGSA